MDSTIERVETDSTVDFELVATETDHLVEPSDPELSFMHAHKNKVRVNFWREPLMQWLRDPGLMRTCIRSPTLM